MERKAIIILVLALALSFTTATTVFAETKTIVLTVGSPNMTVNGVSQEIDPGRGTKPLTISGRTLVPIRTIIENMGGTIAWDGALQTVMITAAGKNIKLKIDDTTAYIKDQSVADLWTPKALDVPAKVMNARTMVPLRFVTENIGATVAWAAATKTITITFGVAAFDPLNWSGSWTIGGGTAVFNHSGNLVTGTMEGFGQIKGTASGRTLSATWYQNIDSQGQMVLTLSEDGKSFTGKWRYYGPGNMPNPDDEQQGWSADADIVGQR